MAVYLIHSTLPLANPNGRLIRHYLGYVTDGQLARRLTEHRNNRHSARLVQAFLAKGADLWVGNYWPGLTPTDEQRMKRAGHLSSRCLVCEVLDMQRLYAEMITSAGVSGQPLIVPSLRQDDYSTP